MTTNRIATPDQVCAVIVTYGPSDTFFNDIKQILDQVGHVVLVDNGSNTSTQQKLEELTNRHTGQITLLYNTENNLAKAQNIGIAQARRQQFGYVLLLDDDSEPAADMVEQLLNAYNRESERQTIGLVAPHMIDTKTDRETTYLQSTFILGFTRQTAAPGSLIHNVLHVIASGSLIPIPVFDAIGHIDESYVIDYLDKEFCLRLIRHDYRIVVVCDATLKHSIGNCCDHHIAGQRITATNHSSLRRYYIYRNRLRTWGRYLFACPSFVVHDFLAIGYDLARILLFEADRADKLKAILSGTIDAARGVHGHKPDNQQPFEKKGTVNNDG